MSVIRRNVDKKMEKIPNCFDDNRLFFYICPDEDMRKNFLLTIITN